MQKELKQLTTLPFLICLSLLLLNDFFFKTIFHNYLTGKLSDVCGLFIFPIFWSVIFPKYKVYTFFVTALLFTLWKSPYSNSFIEFFSAYFFPIERVVDVSDLIALAMLPVGYYSLNTTWTTINLQPWLAAVVTFFSFCATSLPRPIQHFEQPQYVLFEIKGLITDFNGYLDTNEHYQDLKADRINNFLVVEVVEIETRDKPAKDDDYHKNIILEDLDSLVQNKLYTNISTALRIPNGINNIVIERDGYSDKMAFEGSRLNGKFERIDSVGKVLIEGYYREGLEDSIWTFRDSFGKAFSVKTFINGEAIKIENFENGVLYSSTIIKTRKETINNKQFQIVLLSILSIAFFLLIVKNYRDVHPKEANIGGFYKGLFPVVLPISVIVLKCIFNLFVPDPYISFFGIFSDVILIYILGTPFFLLVFFYFKVHKKLDVLWYTLLFALLFILWQEVAQLGSLTSEMI